MDGQPLQIIVKNDATNSFELNEEALAEVLQSPDVADKQVCVLAVAGAFRKGKSFLLDFLLQYCAHESSQAGGDWLGDTTRPLQGFKWSQGFQRETNGILMWSKPFIMRAASGEQVAVILLDTQGTYDTESSVKDSTLVFALTLLVSSVVVYNLMNNIQEDDLMNLQTFTSYGIQAQEGCGASRAFQKLMFLVRDWGFPSKKPYGSEGGQDVLDTVLEVKEGQHPAHQDVRRDLRECFDDLSCYLMPHPGFKALEDEDFDGRVVDLEKKFVDHLRVLAPLLLAPENLVVKAFGGQPITAKDLYNFFTTFMEVIRDNDLPEPTTFVEFNARISSQKALEVGKEVYMKNMDAEVREQAARIVNQLEKVHEKVKYQAVAAFLKKNRAGRRNKRVIKEYQTKLENEVRQVFETRFAPLASSMAAMEAGKKSYEREMKEILSGSALKYSLLESLHNEQMQKAVNVYEINNAYGRDNLKIFEHHLDQLKQAIQVLYPKYKTINKNKHENETAQLVIAGVAGAGLMGASWGIMATIGGFAALLSIGRR